MLKYKENGDVDNPWLIIIYTFAMYRVNKHLIVTNYLSSDLLNIQCVASGFLHPT